MEKRLRRSCSKKTKGKEKVCSSSSSSSSNWACLPDDLLDSILEKLILFPDYIRFGAVCKSWNSMALNHKEKRTRQRNHQLPFLLQLSKQKDGQKVRNLYNFISAQSLDSKLRIPNNRNHFCGSSHGWLIYFRPVMLKLVLYSPLYGTIISTLPPLDIRFKRVPKVEAILSSDPSFGSFEVLALCENRKKIAYLQFGDESWIYTRGYNSFPAVCSFKFYKDCMLGVFKGGKIFSINIVISGTHYSSSYLEIAAITPNFWEYFSEHFFVETTKGDLLMVLRYMVYKIGIDKAYKIFKLVESNGKIDRIPVEDLGGDSLFLEHNNCTSVLASDYPGCRPNSIYRTCKDCDAVSEFNLGDLDVKWDRRFETSGYLRASWIMP